MRRRDRRYRLLPRLPRLLRLDAGAAVDGGGGVSSSAETLLAVQLEQAGIPFEREVRFAPPRRWRFDFAWPRDGYSRWPQKSLAVEVEGGAFTGGHRRGTRADLDCEKANAAALAGWTVLRFTPAMVDDGRALAVIRQALGVEHAA